MQVCAPVVHGRTSAFRWRPVAVALGAAASAFLYVAVRASTARSIPQITSWRGFCQRVDPPDPWPCHVIDTAPVRGYLLAALLIWLALAGVTVVLALAGRGAWSFVPLAGVAVAQLIASAFPDQGLSSLPWLGVRSAPFWTSRLGSGYWATHDLWAALVDLVVLAAPALLALVLLRPARVPLSWRGRPRFVLATILALVVAFAIVWFTEPATWHELGESWGIPIWTPAAVMATFGLLLPSGSRRWAPLCVAAVLLSAGPSTLILSASMRFPTTLWFTSVVPLLAVGAVTAVAEPIALRWEGHRQARPDDTRRVRPGVLLTATAVGLVAVSMIAAAADPLPARFGTALPTYLGLRDRAEAARAEQNLLMAFHAFDVARRTGVRTFDPVVGDAVEPALLWRDGRQPVRTLAVAIVRSGPSLVRFTTVTQGGSAVCAQATAAGGWRPTFGLAASQGTADIEPALREAIAACGSQPLTGSPIGEVAALNATLCDGLERDGIVLCRAVQHLVTERLTSPRGRW